LLLSSIWPPPYPSGRPPEREPEKLPDMRPLPNIGLSLTIKF